ncbi:MAG: NYN domain-containing protein [Pleurocapsa sp. SU_196_0]|nr:NYN domain-containing protein [Pleurocapsa sp. SU_196_0]
MAQPPDVHELGDTALFVDAENVSLAHPGLHRLRLWLEARGRIVAARAYGAWSDFGSRQTATHPNLHTIAVARSGDKNLTDAQLMLDALELALSRAHLSSVVLVSGDRDFLPLVHKLRTLGKRVLIAVPHAQHAQHFHREASALIVFADAVRVLAPHRIINLQAALDALERVTTLGPNGGDSHRRPEAASRAARAGLRRTSDRVSPLFGVRAACLEPRQSAD